jgi:hypothetical protein
MESDEYCEICGITAEQLEAQGFLIKSVADCAVMGFRICIDCCVVAGGSNLEECSSCEMGKRLEGSAILV